MRALLHDIHNLQVLPMRSLVLACWLLITLAEFCSAQAPTMDWIRQFGAPKAYVNDGDSISGMSLDGLGNLFIAGDTWGNLFGPNGGNQDVFLAKFDLAGNQQWGRQYSVPSQQRGGGVATDTQGNLFVSAFDADPVVSSYDQSGNVNWTRHGFGGDHAIAADGNGHVYAATTVRVGAGEDGRLGKFDANGNQIWSRQFGSESDFEQSIRVSADAIGNVFAYGAAWYPTGGTSRRPAAFLTKFDSAGNEEWTHQLRSARYVNAGGVAVDGLGNVYVCGNTNAPLAVIRPATDYDAFLAKYNANGDQVWIREFGTADLDDANGIALDGLGNVYLAGSSYGSFGGPNAGGVDAYLAKFDVDGNQHWVHQFGTAGNDSASLIAVDTFGNLYVGGHTRGDLGGTNSGGGGSDFFLAKFSVGVPEPSSVLLLAMSVTVANACIRVRGRAQNDGKLHP